MIIELLLFIKGTITLITNRKKIKKNPEILIYSYGILLIYLLTTTLIIYNMIMIYTISTLLKNKLPLWVFQYIMYVSLGLIIVFIILLIIHYYKKVNELKLYE